MALRAGFFSLNKTPALPPPPMPPDDLTGLLLATTGTNRANVLVSWGASDGADGYIVEYDNGGGWTQIADTASTSYTHTTPTAGIVTHPYRVKAYNDVGDSAWATGLLPGLLLNLVAYWTLSDGLWTDLVSGLTLTEVGDVTLVTGLMGNAAKMNTTPSYLTLPTTGLVEMSGVDFAVSAFVNPNPATNDPIMGKDDNAGNREWGLFCVSGQLWVEAFRAGGATAYVTRSGFTTGAFHHVFASFNATTYQIGARLDGGTTGTANLGGALVGATSVPFNIGYRDGNTSNSEMQHVGLWRGRIPSDAEQLALTNGGAGLPYPFS